MANDERNALLVAGGLILGGILLVTARRDKKDAAQDEPDYGDWLDRESQGINPAGGGPGSGPTPSEPADVTSSGGGGGGGGGLQATGEDRDQGYGFSPQDLEPLSVPPADPVPVSSVQQTLQTLAPLAPGVAQAAPREAVRADEPMVVQKLAESEPAPTIGLGS